MYQREIACGDEVGRTERGRARLFDRSKLIEQWPIRPPILQRELLSSWLGRVAANYGVTVHDLTNWPTLPATRTQIADFDKCHNLSFRDYLGAGSGIGRSRIDDATLAVYEGIVFDKLVQTNSGQWIIPLEMGPGRFRQNGQPYCPICLSEDPVPYFRQAWRLAFYTFCPKHHRLLLNRCIKCAAPIDPIAPGACELSRSGKLRWCCAACGHCIACARPRAFQPEFRQGLSTHEALLHQFESGSIRFPSGLVFDQTTLFFQGLRQIVSWFVRPRTWDKICTVLPSEGIRLLPESLSEMTAPFEACSIAVRHEMIRLSMILLDDWPNRFIGILRNAGLSAWLLTLDKSQLPYWLDAVIQSELTLRNRHVTEEEVVRAKGLLQRPGEDVSRNRVKHFLGVTESKAVTAMIPKMRDYFTVTETKRFFWEFDRQIRFASPARGHRMNLARDRTIVLMSACGLGSLATVTNWTIDMFPDIVKQCQASSFDPRRPPAVFGTLGVTHPNVHLAWYFNFVLDRWDNRRPGQPVLAFPSRNATPVHPETVKIRAGIVKSKANLDHLSLCVEGFTLPSGAKLELYEVASPLSQFSGPAFRTH